MVVHAFSLPGHGKARNDKDKTNQQYTSLHFFGIDLRALETKQRAKIASSPKPTSYLSRFWR